MSRLRLRFYNAIDRLLTFARHCHFSSWWFCVCGWAEFWGKLKDAIVKEKPKKIERERRARLAGKQRSTAVSDTFDTRAQKVAT